MSEQKPTEERVLLLDRKRCGWDVQYRRIFGTGVFSFDRVNQIAMPWSIRVSCWCIEGRVAYNKPDHRVRQSQWKRRFCQTEDGGDSLKTIFASVQEMFLGTRHTQD